MKIIAISDLHGQLPNITETAECLFICGDVVPLYCQTNSCDSLQWLNKKFMPWLKSLNITGDIFIIGGNHDFIFERKPNEVKKLLQSYNKVHYLCNETYEYLAEDCVTTWTIFGTPDCHIFGNWAFMYEPETETQHFNKMPDNVDIVLSHDACYGRNDACLETTPWTKPNKHIGNPELLQAVKNKKPLYQFTGHLHSSSHELINYDGTQTACVSLLNEHYKMTYKPLVIELTK